jgi:acyl-coenzyme A synthetase/AMP-(fatty) acid ligase
VIPLTTTLAPRSGKVALSSRRASAAQLLRGQFQTGRIWLHKPINLGVMAELAAERYGRDGHFYLDQPFTWDPQQRVELDYVEFAELVEQMSAVLKQAGVGRRDRVAIIKTPNYDVQALAWAAARIGAIAAPISARLDPGVLNVLLDRLQPKVLITDPDVVRHARLDAARLRALSCTAIAPVDGGIPVEDLWGGPVPAPSPVKDDEPMIITHTSSTTGVSKMAEASAIGVTFSAQTEAVVPFAHSPDELFASAISHVHIRGAVTQMASMSRGTPVLGIANPDNETILRLFARYRPTMVETHPNTFVAWEQLADDSSRPFASIRIWLNTFDAIHPRTIRRLLDASERRFPLWFQCYGMTETQVVSVRAYTKRMAARLVDRDSRTVGWEVPGVRVRIADPATGERRRSQRQPGMIQAKTPARALSFIGTPEKFAERRHGKWFDTGDWGRRGRWYQVEVLDRIADRIDGVDSCLRLEDLLMDRLPDAEEIIVTPDGTGKPVPVVCMRDGKRLTAEDWQRASAGLPGLGEPFEVSPDQLQRTATVKARRFLLTEMIKSSGSAEPVRPEVALRDGA